jgi:integrase
VERRLKLHIEPYFTGRNLAGITKGDVEAYVVARQADGASNATCNRELAVIKRIFSLAMDNGKITVRPKIKMLREDNARQEFLDPAEFEAVCGHFPAPVAAAVRFAYTTGWRIKSEVLTLEWRNFDTEAETVSLDGENSKNGEPRTFFYVGIPALKDSIDAQAAEHARLKREGVVCPFVFHRNGSRIKNIRAAWETACTAAGFPGRVPHDMRRSAARNLVRAGVSENVAMRLLGHKTRAVFDRYDVTSEADKIEAGKLLGQLLGQPEAKTAQRGPVVKMQKRAATA